MNTGSWFVLGLLVFGILAVFCFLFVDYNRAKKKEAREEDMRLTLRDGNIWMYYDRPIGAPFNPFTCDKIFIRIFESRDGYTKFEKQVFSQSYNKADKHEGTYTDAMSRENLYILLKAREAKLIVDCNKKA